MQRITQFIDRAYDHKRFDLVAAALIAAAILIAYSNSFTAVFQFDDTTHLHENPAIKEITGRNVATLLKTTRPATNLSLMLNYAVSGLNVVGWHVFNVGVHIANSILFYFFILRTLLLPVFSGRYSNKAKGMALFCALLFAVHPLQTESVTYIISRSELLAAFFSFATFLFYLSGIQTGRFRYHAASFITTLLAIGSKEWAVTIPFMVFLYDLLFLSISSWRILRSHWKALALLFLPWAQITVILPYYAGANSAGFSMSGMKGITPGTYLLTSLNVLWTYVRLLVLPIGQNLDHDYPLATTLFALPTLISFLAHVLVAGGALWAFLRKKWVIFPFCIAWFYIIISPTQSFVPIIDLIFEHRAYMPSAGLFLLFTIGADRVLSRLADRSGNPRPAR